MKLKKIGGVFVICVGFFHWGARAQGLILEKMIEKIDAAPPEQKHALVEAAFNQPTLAQALPQQVLAFADIYLQDLKDRMPAELNKGRLPLLGRAHDVRLRTLPEVKDDSQSDAYREQMHKKIENFRENVYLPMFERRLCVDLASGHLPPNSLAENDNAVDYAVEFPKDTYKLGVGQNLLKLFVTAAELEAKKGGSTWSRQLPEVLKYANSEDIILELLQNPAFKNVDLSQLEPRGPVGSVAAYRMKQILLDPVESRQRRRIALESILGTDGILSSEDVKNLKGNAGPADAFGKMAAALRNDQWRKSDGNKRAHVKGNLDFETYFNLLDDANFDLREAAIQHLLDTASPQRPKLLNYLRTKLDGHEASPEQRIRAQMILDVFDPKTMDIKKVCNQIDSTSDEPEKIGPHK